MSPAPRKEVFIDSVPGEIRLAVTDQGKLVDLVVERSFEKQILGSIYLGRIEKVNPGLNAAFVDIGEAQSGFLAAVDGQVFNHDTEKPKPISELFKEGDAVVVQVTRESSEGKGPKLTTRLDINGPNLVLTPNRPGLSISKKIKDQAIRSNLQKVLADFVGENLGLIVRTKAEDLPSDILQSEAQNLLELLTSIDKNKATLKPPVCLLKSAGLISKYLSDANSMDWQRVVLDDRILMKNLVDENAESMPQISDLFEMAQGVTPLFETYDLDQQFDELFEAEVKLPSGGGLKIEEVAALVAIDVDSGAHSRVANPEDYALAVNLEAALEIGRQITLRNLSGQIVVDFLRMKRRENRDKIQAALSSALSSAGHCNVFGFSRLGLMELTRKRNGESLSARFLSGSSSVPTPQSLAITLMRRILSELAHNPGKRLTINCRPRLYAALQTDMSEIWQGLLERVGPVVILNKIDLQPELAEIGFDIQVI